MDPIVPRGFRVRRLLGVTPSPFDAPHGRPGAFFVPWNRFPVRITDVLRWKARPNPYRRRRNLAKREGRFAAALDPLASTSLAAISAGEAMATWVGHATYLLQSAGEVIVTDPHWGARALVPPRLAPPGLPLSALPESGIAIVSHDHYDHLDLWTVRRMPSGFHWFVPWGLKRWFERFAPEVATRVTEFDWWQSAEHGRHRLTFLPAQHWSNRLAHGRFSTLWGSWMIESSERTIYFAGDSGYFGGYAEIGRRFPRIDAALLPIGAYEPRWFMKYQHMDPEESLQAFRDLGARHFLAAHWGVFDLTDEPPSEAPRVLEPLVRADERDRVHVPLVGGRVEI
jgi:L-ascorbate metabolism protein UlaG (beta-lactamase superfamily)